MSPKKEYERFAVKTRAAGFTGRIGINSKKLLIILKKKSARRQCDDKKTGEHNPQDEEELSVILHAFSIF
jgi:hypothetical protein